MWFALVCIIEDNYQIQAPGSLYLEGLIVGGIFGFQIGGGGGGGSIRRGLFSEFYGMLISSSSVNMFVLFEFTTMI